jgi:flagellum-specific ATP synthase
MTLLAPEIETLQSLEPMEIRGRVETVRGLSLLVDDLPVPIGATVRIKTRLGETLGEVVGFNQGQTIVMTLTPTVGIREGDVAIGVELAQTARVGTQLLGRVVNGLLEPIDGGPRVAETSVRPLVPKPLAAMRRRLIHEPLATGVRSIDTMTTLGKGQRVGIFAGPGIGKSTLLGCIAKGTSADINVIALIGERGREVRDFIENVLGPTGLSRSVVVAATSDESPLLRIRATMAACAVAEHFRDLGADVLFMMDSVTRFAQAQRQVGLSIGEPPATKGYTPSVFATLPQLLERAGAIEGGTSITGIYTILVEGDDMTEPIADAARGVLDGHIILSRKLADRGHYPAVDVLGSVSRVATDVTTAEHVASRRQVVQMVSAFEEIRELLQIGAYARGSSPESDAAIDIQGRVNELLRQDSDEIADYEASSAMLQAVAAEARQLLNRPSASGPS